MEQRADCWCRPLLVTVGTAPVISNMQEMMIFRFTSITTEQKSQQTFFIMFSALGDRTLICPGIHMCHSSTRVFFSFIYFYQHEVIFLRLIQNWIIWPLNWALSRPNQYVLETHRVLAWVNEIIKHVFNKSINRLLAAGAFNDPPPPVHLPSCSRCAAGSGSGAKFI